MDFEKVKNKFKNDDIWFDGDEGSSFEDTVTIRGTKNTVAGVSAEKSFISSRFGQEGSDWYFLEQELFLNDKAYDVITIGLSDGTFEKVYFDISEFYGKGIE